MLSREFLEDLRDAFPTFYTRVNEEAMHEASRLRAETGGDIEKALMKTRIQGAGALWWPYVKGSIPFFGDDRPAMEVLTRLVLTVDHVVGYQPNDMETAREQVVRVLEQTFDMERVRELLKNDASEEGAAAVGMLASATALLAPLRRFGSLSKKVRFIPMPARIAIGAAIVVTLASIPLMAGYSAGTQAERAARNFGELPKSAKPTKTPLKP